jgi:polysaccharide pyruvyl transferase WcaK-like protein
VTTLAFYGYLGSGNFGNDASLETVVDWLSAEHPSVNLRCITLAPDVCEERYRIPSVPLASLAPRAGPDADAPALRKLAGRLGDLPRSLRLAGSADAVIIPGMGVLEESLDVQPWGLPTWLFLLASACRLRRRPFILLDVGAEPARNPLTQRLFAATARLATHLSVRDHWSADSLRAAGVSRPAEVAPDLAFAHPCPIRADPVPGLVAVGVMAYDGRRGDVMAGPRQRHAYLTSMTAALSLLLDDGHRLVLLGGDLVDSEVAHDLAVALAQARPGLADRVTVPPVTTFAEVSMVMARAEVAVASRFHNLIAALRLSRPTVSVGYSAKSVRLMRSLSLEDYHRRIEDLDAVWLVDRVRRARQDSAALTAGLDAAIRGYAPRVEELLAAVARQDLGLPPSDGSTA